MRKNNKIVVTGGSGRFGFYLKRIKSKSRVGSYFTFSINEA